MSFTIEDFIKISGSYVLNADVLRRNILRGVSIDSRKISKQNVFFAIKGEKFDGHNFIPAVVKKGIKTVVIDKRKLRVIKQKLGGKFKDVCWIAVDDTVKSFGELASVYRNRFFIPVIAIGGSNGKTSVKDFISYVLSEKFSVLKSEGNFNNRIGLPLTLFNLNRYHDIAVVEAGTNQFGEIEELCRIAKPQFGLITNIGKEHLEFLKNIKGVCKEEGRLIDYLESVYGTFFLNKDDKNIRKLSYKRKLNIYSYSSLNNANLTGRIKSFKLFYPEIFITSGMQSFTTTLSMAGMQSFYAALTAAVVGSYFNVPVKQITSALHLLAE